MSHSQFRLENIETKLGLTIEKSPHLFQDIKISSVSESLQETLDYNLPLDLEVSTEKAYFGIITPILIELKKIFHPQISLFLGRTLEIKPSQGLTRVCDYIISKFPSQLILKLLL